MCFATFAAPYTGAAFAACRIRGSKRSPGRRWALLGLGLILITAVSLALTPAKAAPQIRQPVRAQVGADVSGGFARLVFAFGDEVNSSVHSAGNILIVTFDRPVYVTVEHLAIHASEYVVAARRDPDGRAVRFALSRKVLGIVFP
jgi:hypothetical protein